MTNKTPVKKISKNQKLKSLKIKLNELKEVKLKQALSKYGEAFQDSGSSLYQNAAWELADEEVSVLRAMIAQVEAEIKSLETPPLSSEVKPINKSK